MREDQKNVPPSRLEVIDKQPEYLQPAAEMTRV